ncbi:hypothetical protein ACIR03_02470 [Clostridium cochlearium]|uniref:hypothetical protein n=1 Tax=Clostridium cochlearium TaxID=1494 RepID=UPI003F6563F1
MSEFQNEIVFELSKKYVFENFDFKNKSPEDLLKFYQETSERISKIIEEQNAEIANQSMEMLSKLNW